MKPKPLLLVLCISCLIFISYAVNPACECVIFQSYGRTTGTFTSPNFPQIYPSNVNCILYTFIGDLDEIVELTFLEFDLQVPTTNKCQDFLKFFLDLERPEVNEQHQWNYDLCGNISMIQKKHYSSERSLILEFHTDNFQGNHTGFRGIFKFLDKAQYAIEGGVKRWGTECAHDFYSNKNSKTGKFFSQKYPQNYPPDANCQYVFYGDPNERVRLVFQNIQLENIDGSCSDSPDIIVVRDGKDTSSPVIAQYCNTLNTEQVTSSGNHLYVEFIVDEKKQRQGFAATFQFLTVEEQLRQTKPTPTIPTKFPPGTHGENSKDAPYPPINGIDNHNVIIPTISTPKTPENCEFTYLSTQAKNGTFTSPGYPHPYPADHTCRYIFQGQGRERVQIIFSDLDLNYPEGNPAAPYDCEAVDSVTISINAGGTQRDIGIYCGSKRPPMLMSNSNNLEVTFFSRAASDKKGFKAQYNFLTNFGIYAGKQKTDVVCGFIFNSDETSNGTFTSPNFPGMYPRNTECHYLFYGRDDEKVHITFPYFDVEGIPPGCTESTESDYVEFSNFKVPDRKMNRFCGSKEKGTKSETSDGSFFRVTFRSNDIYDATGFEAYYQFRRGPNSHNVPGPQPNPGQRIDPSSSGNLVPTILLQLIILLIWTWTS